MPKCMKCGFHDDTDAEFDNTRSYCEGCMLKAIAEARADDRQFLQYEEYKIGDINVLERAIGDSCANCGSHHLEFIAWNDGLGKYHESIICARGCEDGARTVEDYLFNIPDAIWPRKRA